MKQAILEEARAVLAAGPVALTKLHERLKRAGSAWSQAQHCLFFLAFEGFSVDRTGEESLVLSDGQSHEDRLQSEIVKVVDSFAGKPVPAKEIRKKLPAEFVTTDEQVKAIAKKSDKIEVFGPGLIRKK